MKKSWLFVLLSVFLLSGCRENYLAEKEFWKATQILKHLTAEDFKASGVHAVDPAIEAFERVADKYPTTPKAAESFFIISRLKGKEKRYDEARAALEKVVQNFTGSGTRASEARFEIGHLYETEKKWDKAEEAYWQTAEDYPTDPRGLYAPMYVFSHYKKENDLAGKDRAYQKALHHYRKTLEQIGPIQASGKIRHYRALTYLANDEWEKAKDEWLAVEKDLSDTPFAPLGILAAAEITSQKGSPDEAIKLYRSFLEKYPKHLLVGQTKVRLGLLYQSQEKREFGQARKWFEEALNQHFSKDKTQSAELKLLIGKTYQDEGRWPEADQIYKELQNENPTAVASLQVPFLAYMYYESTGDSAKAKSILDEAVEHYQDLAKQYPGTKIEGYARGFINTAYAKMGDWNAVLVNIDEEIKSEKNQFRKGQWLLVKALIAEKRLKDKEKALSFYNDFLTQYPDHPLTSAAKSHLQILTQN